MRTLMIAATLLSPAAIAAPAEARDGRPGMAQGSPAAAPTASRPAGQWRQGPGGHRWSHRVNGRWIGGVRAPGGWAAYRRPVRGWTVPRYWFAPSFVITDYAVYGLSTPPYGYRWIRYYDDAVMIDPQGRVHDSVSGIDWEGDDGGYDDPGYADDYAYEEGDRYSGPEDRRDSGLGGAVIGGVAGGLAGNAIAGRGDRLAGTIIGAGVGAVAGAAIDRAEDRGRHRAEPPVAPERGAPYPPPPGYDEGYDDPEDGGYPPRVAFAPPREQVQPYHYERSTGCVTYCGGAGPAYPPPPPPPPPHVTSYSSGGYIAGGYYYPPVTTTTVTIGAPTITTTVTEIAGEESVTYTPKRFARPAAKAVRKQRCYCR